MTPDEFTALATRLAPGLHAKAILASVQLQVGGKTFATVGWPETGWAVVKVEPLLQGWALSLSQGLAPEPGRRRKAGIVLARLAAIDEAVAVDLLAAALRYATRGSKRPVAEPLADIARTAA